MEFFRISKFLKYIRWRKSRGGDRVNSNSTKYIKDNVTKTYKKSSDLLEKSINMEVKHITKELEVSGRIEHLARNPAFITLKDHNENFDSKLLCCVINPSQSELGKVSKQILEKSTKQWYNI